MKIVTTLPGGPDGYITDSTIDAVVDSSTPTETTAAAEINLHLSQERLETMKAGILRRVSQQDYQAIFQFAARFMVKRDGSYMTEEEAFEILDELSNKDIGELTKRIIQEAQDLAAPKV